MKIDIHIELLDRSQIDFVLAQIPFKITAQLERSPEAICTHPEDDDIIRDLNGNRCGTLRVIPDPDDHDEMED